MKPICTLNETRQKGTSGTHLVGNVEGIHVGMKTNVSLLLAVRSDQGVDAESIHVVQLLDGFLDLTLVGLDVDEEDESVVVLNLLHGVFRVQRLKKDAAPSVLAQDGQQRLSGREAYE
jgi:hypothetical protein